MTWIKQNALSLLIGFAVIAGNYAVVEWRLGAIETRLDRIEQKVGSHEADPTKHMDERFLNRLMQQLDRVERIVDELNKRER